MSESHFLASEIANYDPQDAFFHVIPAGFEATVSYVGGTAKGPAAILEASNQLELWDGESVPAESGIYTTEAVDCSGSAEEVLEAIQKKVEASLSMDAIPVLLGGEHTVTLGALRALHKKGERFGVVQFDAHADLRDMYEGSPLSHACVMRRALDLDIPIFQIGVRAMCQEEAHLRRHRRIPHLDARALAFDEIPPMLLPPEFPENVYITFDVDGLDPSVIRATGTPVPGGLGWHQALALVERVVAGRRVVGLDVVELAPQPGDHASDFAAAQLAYCLMGAALRSRT